jgi:hypothetical protein
MGRTCSARGEKRLLIGFRWESQKEDLDVGGRIILKLILDMMGWYLLD